MNTIAQTIYQQLGGNKFAVMTGAKQFLFDDKSLAFKIPRKPYIKITLNGKDLYDIEFIKIKRLNEMQVKQQTIKSINDIYCDQLVHILEQQTGLYFSL
jgi:hypothetical protein